jgi:hypothetical protein
MAETRLAGNKLGLRLHVFATAVRPQEMEKTTRLSRLHINHFERVPTWSHILRPGPWIPLLQGIGAGRASKIMFSYF